MKRFKWWLAFALLSVGLLAQVIFLCTRPFSDWYLHKGPAQPSYGDAEETKHRLGKDR